MPAHDAANRHGGIPVLVSVLVGVLAIAAVLALSSRARDAVAATFTRSAPGYVELYLDDHEEARTCPAGPRRQSQVRAVVQNRSQTDRALRYAVRVTSDGAIVRERQGVVRLRAAGAQRIDANLRVPARRDYALSVTLLDTRQSVRVHCEARS